jgi:hypothetical protein
MRDDRLPFPLWLYPARWRERYGREVAALLASEPRTTRLMLDLVAGAVDAHLTPQSITGATPMTHRLLCPSAALSPEDRFRSNVILIGGSLMFAIGCLVVSLMFPGARKAVQVLLSLLFPVALVMAGYWTYLRPYRPAVRIRLILIEMAIVLPIVVLAAILARLL